MRIALVHDHLLANGGAERVLEVLLKLYPDADVYTAFASNKNIENIKSKTSGRFFVSPYNIIPFSHRLADWYKPLILFYWESLDLTSYDLVISSSHSFSSKSVITQPKTLHIAYVYTPPRYLYTEYNETQIINKHPFKLLLSPIMTWLRLQDFLGAQRPDVLIAISQIVQARIKKYYRRDSLVIYPPIKIPGNIPKLGRKEYFLIVSRLVKQKGIDLAIEACNKLKLPLVVIGEGSEEKRLKSIAGPTITFKGFIPDNKMSEIYSRAKALLYCSREEDFGLTPVEAMAHGMPVIAYNSGGVRETVIHKVTGIIFKDYTIKAISSAIQKFKSLRFSETLLVQHAKMYSEKLFMHKLNQLIVQQGTHIKIISS
jgi:glycosyltransferase involved in cell wall biosynthesis